MIERRQLAARRGSITALSELVSPQYVAMRAWFQDVVSEHLEEAIRFARYKGAKGGIPRLLISMPRRCCKTEYASVLTPASILGMSPETNVMGSAYNRELVGEMVSRTREHMVSEAYESTYSTRVGRVIDTSASSSRVVSAKDTAYMMKTLKRDPDGRVQPAGGSYYAVGVKGGATGHGFDLGIIDDWVRDMEQARSPAEKRRRVNFYNACFESSQEGVAAILAIATTWQKNGFLRWLYDLWRDQGYEPVWLRFPALFDPETASEFDRRTKLDQPLWPIKFPFDHLNKVRRGLMASDPNTWWALYQQHGRAESGVIFPASMWRWYGENFDLGNIQEIHFSCDPNVKASGKSFGCCGVYGVIDSSSFAPSSETDYGLNYFRLDEARGHWDYTALRAEVKRLVLKWKRELPDAFEHPRSKIWIENKANGPALYSDLRATYPELARMIELVPKMQNKESCYRMAAPFAKDHTWFPRVKTTDETTPADWGPITRSWADMREKGNIVDECEAQQPTHEPNDRPDELSQLIICREPSLGPYMLRL